MYYYPLRIIKSEFKGEISEKEINIPINSLPFSKILEVLFHKISPLKTRSKTCYSISIIFRFHFKVDKNDPSSPSYTF